MKPVRAMQRTGVVPEKLRPWGWWKNDGWMRFPKGLRVRTRVEGDAWRAESLAMVESLVMGFPFVARISTTAA